MTPINNLLDSLVERVKTTTIKWTSLDCIKSYLRKNQESLSDIKVFQLYTEYLRKDNFIFDCKESYISLTDSHLYILSKNLYDLEYRLDKFNFCSKKEWINTDFSTSSLLRLKNIIALINSDSEDKCTSVLTSLKDLNL